MITNRMQFKSTQVGNVFPPLPGRPDGRLCFGRAQKTENAQTISRMYDGPGGSQSSIGFWQSSHGFTQSSCGFTQSSLVFTQSSFNFFTVQF